MKCFTTTDFLIEEPTALAIGKFDGLHRGHELLLTSLLQKKDEGLTATIFTFQTPPAGEQKVLSPNDEKQALFEKAGVDVMIECPFTKEIRELSPEAFLRKLKAQANVKCIVAGTDCRFGHDRAGTAETLREFADVLSYEAIIVEKMQYEGQDISSTLIRDAVTRGEMEKANALLGYPYFVEGEVSHGNEIGRTIGIPTMNLAVSPEKLLPPFGVYASRTIYHGESYAGITNIGVKPTIGSENPVAVETHLFDFHKETYGEEIRTELLSYLRPEMKFDSLEDLKAQMNSDLEKAKSIFVT